MGFQFLAIRTAEEDDGSLYPVVGEANDRRHLIAIEPLDGTAIDQATVKAIYVRELQDAKLVTTNKLLEIEPTLYVTDARVAVACAKFDKGGGWIGFGAGGLVTAGVLNVASKARAAHRRKGKLLVGHARYPWISDVGFSPKAGMLSTEDLRVVVGVSENGHRRKVYIDFSLGRGASAARLAHSIARRCAGYRLAHDHAMTPEKREAYTALAATRPRDAEPKKFVMYKMPDYWFVSSKTAYPEPLELSPAPPTAPALTPAPPPAPAPAPAPALERPTAPAPVTTAPPAAPPTRLPERLVVVLDPSDDTAPAPPPATPPPPAAPTPEPPRAVPPPAADPPPAPAPPPAASPPPGAAAPATCPQCATPARVGAAFCAGCGTRLTAAS